MRKFKIGDKVKIVRGYDSETATGVVLDTKYWGPFKQYAVEYIDGKESRISWFYNGELARYMDIKISEIQGN